MRVLITGDRLWDDGQVVRRVLGGLLDEAIVNFDDLTIIEGCCRRKIPRPGHPKWGQTGEPVGADFYACHYFDGCKEFGHGTHNLVHHEHYPADWDTYGKSAGMRRNRQMLEGGQPDLVVAFHDALSLFGSLPARYAVMASAASSSVRRPCASARARRASRASIGTVMGITHNCGRSPPPR